MKRIIGKATLMVMGLFAYLILSIQMYQNAMAAPVGETDSHSLATWYEMHGDTEMYYTAVMVVSNGIVVAVNAQAIAECTVDGSTEYSCVEARRGMLVGYVTQFTNAVSGGVSNAHGADAFWKWAIEMKLDEEVHLGFAISIYVYTIARSFESES